MKSWKILPLIILFIPSLAFAVDTNTTVSSTVTGTSSNTVTGTTTVDRTPSTAASPNIMLNNQDVCTTAMAGAAQSAWFGLSFGNTVVDKNCERLKLARSLYGMGMKVASVSLLCQDTRVFQAMEQAGTPCPVDGKLGEEAKQIWDKQPHRRPDYDEWKNKKENQKVVEVNTHTGNTYNSVSDNLWPEDEEDY